jgi:hypothetical protein
MPTIGTSTGQERTSARLPPVEPVGQGPAPPGAPATATSLAEGE